MWHRSMRPRARRCRASRSRPATSWCSTSPAAAEPRRTTHRLTVRLVAQQRRFSSSIRPASANEYENFGLDANYTLIEIATGKQVAVPAPPTTRVTYNVPGLQQRFTKARARARRRDPRRQADRRADPDRGSPPTSSPARERGAASRACIAACHDMVALKTSRSKPSWRGPIRRARSCWCSARCRAGARACARRSSARASTTRAIPFALVRLDGDESVGRSHAPPRRGADGSAVRRPPRDLAAGRRTNNVVPAVETPA